MPRHSDILRLFVAVYPPAGIAEELGDLVPDTLAPLVRKTPVEQIHLTLFFLGRVMATNIESVVESVDRSCAGQRPFKLTFQKLMALPPRGPKRTLVATTTAPASLLEIRTRLVRKLSRHSREKPNDRFLPHFTVARFKEAPAVEIEKELTLEQVSIHEIRLMRSDLTPEGATHRLVHACKLDGA